MTLVDKMRDLPSSCHMITAEIMTTTEPRASPKTCRITPFMFICAEEPRKVAGIASKQSGYNTYILYIRMSGRCLPRMSSRCRPRITGRFRPPDVHASVHPSVRTFHSRLARRIKLTSFRLLHFHLFFRLFITVGDGDVDLIKNDADLIIDKDLIKSDADLIKYDTDLIINQ